MEENKPQKVGAISPDEFAKLKAKHGTIYVLSVLFNINEDNDKEDEIVELLGYVRKPKRFEMSMALAKKDGNPVGAAEILLNKTWLAGDERIKTDDDAFFATMIPIEEFFFVRFASLKKN